MVNYFPAKLVEFHRHGLVEQEHTGFLLYKKNNGLKKIGDDESYPFYLRSCAKPLQATLLADLQLIQHYDLSDDEIAVCCASHAGETCHTQIVKRLLDKVGVETSMLKCGLHKPLSKVEQNKLLISGDSENVLQNNCSGKHAMMLAICKKMGFSPQDYDEVNHPVQKLIKEKIYSICELKDDYPITKDGCGVPIYSMPLENMLIGYLNLLSTEKYSKIIQSILKYPYIIGGEARLDTALMTANSDLIAKVGAGGLCIVLNIRSEEALLVKVSDCDMKARALIIIEALVQLGWLNETMLENELIKKQNQKDILTLHGEKIGEAKFLFKLN